MTSSKMEDTSHACYNVIFVLVGITLAVLPLAAWFYWENYREVVEPHTLAWLIASCFLGVSKAFDTKIVFYDLSY